MYQHTEMGPNPYDDAPEGTHPETYRAKFNRLYTRRKAAEAVESTLAAERKAVLNYQETEPWTMRTLSEFSATSAVVPAQWVRTDGEHLLYPGKSHALIADGGTGKTLIALAIGRWFADQGEDVLFIDYEDTGETASMRVGLFTDSTDVKSRISYVTGDGDLGDEFQAIARRHWGLVIIDSVDEAMVAVTNDTNAPNDNGTVKLWNQQMVRPFLERGATVLMIDHVSKGKESSKGHARGASAKKDILTGAQLFLEEISPLGAGRDGTLRVRVEKDRPGGLKGFMDDNAAVADINVRSSVTDGVRVFVDPPKPEKSELEKSDDMKRTLLAAVDATPGLKAAVYRSAVTGTATSVRAAWNELREDNYLRLGSVDDGKSSWIVTAEGREDYLT